MQWENMTGHAKKITPIFTTTIFFSQKPALNFVIKLPESQNPTTWINYDMICTIIDGLTKYVKFILCKTTMTAEKLTKLLLKEIFADHGIPE